MIVIKDITCVEVYNDIYCQAYFNPSNLSGKNCLNENEDIKLGIENVLGRTYRNTNGEEVCVGLTKKVQDLLGLPFDEFDRMHKQIDVLNKTLIEKDNIIAKIMNLNFWQRLIFVFKGI